MNTAPQMEILSWRKCFISLAAAFSAALSLSRGIDVHAAGYSLFAKTSTHIQFLCPPKHHSRYGSKFLNY